MDETSPNYLDAHNETGDIQSLGHLHRILTAVGAITLLDAWSKSGIRKPYQAVIMHLLQGERCTQADLVNYTNLTPPTLSKHIDCIEQDGYVVRSIDPDHRRRTFVELTDSGRKKCDEANSVAAQAFMARLKKLSEEEIAIVLKSSQLILRVIKDSDGNSELINRIIPNNK